MRLEALRFELEVADLLPEEYRSSVDEYEKGAGDPGPNCVWSSWTTNWIRRLSDLTLFAFGDDGGTDTMDVWFDSGSSWAYA